jgi:proton glutamate symport protein
MPRYRHIVMSLTKRVILALILGLAAGLVVLAHPSPVFLKIVSLIEPIGTLWVNAIRMTVIPLVVSLLIATIADEKDLAAVGRLGGRAVLTFTVLLAGCALVGFLAGPPLFALLSIDPRQRRRCAARLPARRPWSCRRSRVGW